MPKRFVNLIRANTKDLALISCNNSIWITRTLKQINTNRYTFLFFPPSFVSTDDLWNQHLCIKRSNQIHSILWQVSQSRVSKGQYIVFYAYKTISNMFDRLSGAGKPISRQSQFTQCICNTQVLAIVMIFLDNQFSKEIVFWQRYSGPRLNYPNLITKEV